MQDVKSILKDKLVLVCLPETKHSGTVINALGARDVLVLDKRKSGETERTSGGQFSNYEHWRDIKANNCQVIILHDKSILALGKKRYFYGSRIETILIKKGLFSSLISITLRRYIKKKFVRRLGTTSITFGEKACTYIVLEVSRRDTDNRQVFAPSRLTPIEVLNSLNHLDCVLLRSIEKVEQLRPFKDLDLLIDDHQLDALYEHMGTEVGTVAMDVYSSSGTGGHDFKSVPYFLPSLAKDALESSILRPSGIRSASPKYQYLTYAYHSLFHSKMSHLAPDTCSIGPESFKKADYWSDLADCAKKAGYPTPNKVEDLEKALVEAGYFPGVDLLSFYARRNTFVTGRYIDGHKVAAGLSTVFVRDFRADEDVVSQVRSELQSGFEILAEGKLDGTKKEKIAAKIRGGNWFDTSVKQIAGPCHWFICFDANPVEPSGRIARKYPHSDNANMVQCKLAIRDRAADIFGQSTRIVHASDNAREALEHMQALEIDPKEFSELKALFS